MTKLSNSIYDAIYLVVFNSINLGLLIYAFKKDLKETLTISLTYNFLIINPYTFTLLDFFVYESIHIKFSNFYAGVGGAKIEVALHMILSSFVFITNVVLLIVVSKKRKATNNNMINEANENLHKTITDDCGKLNTFLHSKYSLFVSMSFGSALYILYYYFDLFEETNAFVFDLLLLTLFPIMFYWFVGSVVYSKIREKKVAVAITIALRAGLLAIAVLAANLIFIEESNSFLKACIFAYSPISLIAGVIQNIITDSSFKEVLSLSNVPNASELLKMVISVIVSPISIILVVFFSKINKAIVNLLRNAKDR
ncbi:MAG: hypothetical protein IJ927_05715 [Eubacterium sp.]|nr:hypothetical protein [Eubacterium sp.]